MKSIVILFFIFILPCSAMAKLVLLDIEVDYKNETFKFRDEINVVTAFQDNETKRIFGRKQKVILVMTPKILADNNIEISGEFILQAQEPLEKKEEGPSNVTSEGIQRIISKFQFNGLTGAKSEIKNKNEAEFLEIEVRSHLVDSYGIPNDQDVQKFPNRIEAPAAISIPVPATDATKPKDLKKAE